MQPEFDPKTHRLVKVDLTIWGCTHQQIDGGPLHAVGKVVRPRRRKKRPPKQGAGDYLDLQFEPAALWMSGSGRVRGLCVLSETEWHVLKALVEAGADGVEYGTLIDLVPGWDCEITDDGSIKPVLSRIKTKMDKLGMPFETFSKAVKDEKGRKVTLAFVVVAHKSLEDK